MKNQPKRLEVLLTRMAFFFCGKSAYQPFADRLPISGDERVLDFGCGMGTVAYYIAKKLPHGHLTCLDISERWLKACRKTLRGRGNVTFLHSEAIALTEDSFDVAYCHFVLHDISESKLEAVISALAKCLNSSGVLVFREPLDGSEKLSVIKRLIDQSGLSLKNSRVTDTPIMGNSLECTYTKS